MRSILVFTLLIVSLLQTTWCSNTGDLVPIHWHRCEEVPGLPPPFNQACADLTFTTCSVTAKFTLGLQVIYDNTMDLTELNNPNGKYCDSILSQCTACIEFSRLEVNEQGEGSGCLVLTSSCLSDAFPIGCFDSIPYVGTCSKPCPRDCSHHGKCLYTGECDCDDGYTGESCTNVCDGKRTGDKLEQDIPFTPNTFSTWKGYFTSDSHVAELNMQITLPDVSQQLSVYSRKSCNPSRDQYDWNSFISGGVESLMTMTQDCQDFAGGTWHFLIVCESSSLCSPTITIHETPVKTLNLREPLVTSFVEREYLRFTLQDSSNNRHRRDRVDVPLSLQVLSESKNLHVYLVPGYCPTQSNYLLEAPIRMTLHHTPELNKYLVQDRHAQGGDWFVLITSSDSTESITATVVVADAACKQRCVDGFCAYTDTCQCDSSSVANQHDCSDRPPKPNHDDNYYYDDNYYDNYYNGQEKPPKDHHHQQDAPPNDKSSSASSSSSTDVTTYVLIAVGSFVGLVVLIVGSLGALAVVRRMRRKPAETLYNMLSAAGEDEEEFM